MSNERTGVSTVVNAAFDIENRAYEISRLGAGLQALAVLMQSSDPDRTDGAVDTPILHGLGYLVEVVGEQFQAHGRMLTDQAGPLIRSACTKAPAHPVENDASGLAEKARVFAQELAKV